MKPSRTICMTLATLRKQVQGDAVAVGLVDDATKMAKAMQRKLVEYATLKGGRSLRGQQPFIVIDEQGKLTARTKSAMRKRKP